LLKNTTNLEINLKKKDSMSDWVPSSKSG